MADVAVAAYGVGDIDNLKDTMKEWVTFRGRFEPDPKNRAVYAKIFAQRQKLLAAPLRETFRGLEEIRKMLNI